MSALRRTGPKRDDEVLSIIEQIGGACSRGTKELAAELNGAIVAWAIEANTHRECGGRLPRSVMVCECIDGPYEGRTERISVHAKIVQVQPRDPETDGQLPAERYVVLDVGDGKELFWWPDGGAPR